MSEFQEREINLADSGFPRMLDWPQLKEKFQGMLFILMPANRCPVACHWVWGVEEQHVGWRDEGDTCRYMEMAERRDLEDRNLSHCPIYYYLLWQATFAHIRTNNYCPSLSQRCNSLPSLALFKNNGPKFHFSPRSLLDAFTVLTLV